jgi:CheY-like chemotaxis protein
MLLNVSALHYVKCDSTFRLRRTYLDTSHTFVVTNSAELSRRPSVLIIEDDALVAEMIAEMVSELGYGLAGRAHDTQSAHQALRSDRYDVVLLDMLFQGQKGDELADLLQRNKTPHAFVTDYSEIKPPYDKVPLLIKPFSAEQLRLLLHHLVGPPAHARV